MSEGESIPLGNLAIGWKQSVKNALTKALDERRASGAEILDLVTATPVDPGLQYPAALLSESLDQALANGPASRAYAPEPLGEIAAREAISGYYFRRGVETDPAAVCLVPGTSQGYFHAMRLLANPGDEILVPSPGYPLFDDLASIAGLRVRRYHLKPLGGTEWGVDPDEVAFQITRKTRLLALIAPHNPTGAVIGAGEMAALAGICRRHGVAVLFDEVFREFGAPGCDSFVDAAGAGFPLVVTLNGFSKMFALPGWKVGWIWARGDAGNVTPFLTALERMADAFLPVPDLIQRLIPPLMERGDPAVLRQLSGEVNRRRATLAQALGLPGARLPSGVYLSVPLKRGLGDEETAEELLLRHGVLVHPGYLYDLPHHLVMTCLAEPQVLERAGRAVASFLRGDGECPESP